MPDDIKQGSRCQHRFDDTGSAVQVTLNPWDVKPPLDILWPHWKRVIKKNGAMIFFCQQPFASELVLSNRDIFRYDLIWYKPLGSGFLNAGKMPMRNHEHLLAFYQELPYYNPVMGTGIRKSWRSSNHEGSTNYGAFGDEMGRYYDDFGKRYPQSVIEFTNGNRQIESFHPTQKPLALLRYLVLTYSPKGSLVFDGYAGSGTTAVACVMEHHSFIGAEIDRNYYDYAVKRICDVQAAGNLFDDF